MDMDWFEEILNHQRKQDERPRCGAVDDGEQCRRAEGHSDGHDGERHAWPTDEQMPDLERRMTELMCEPANTGTDKSQDNELGPVTDAKLTEWMEAHRIDTHEAADADPDELATFGEVLDYWTMRGGMTDSERSAFWMDWSRLTIAWTLGLVGAVIIMESFDGLAGKAGLFGAIYAALVLVWQAVEAVRFRWQARRWQR